MGRHDGGAIRKGQHDGYRRGRQPGGGQNQTMWHDGREVELRQSSTLEREAHHTGPWLRRREDAAKWQEGARGGGK